MTRRTIRVDDESDRRRTVPRRGWANALDMVNMGDVRGCLPAPTTDETPTMSPRTAKARTSSVAERARGAGGRFLVLMAATVGYGVIWAADRLYDRAARRKNRPPE